MSATQATLRTDARITPAVEDYLKATYQLAADDPAAGAVTVQRLAERLGVAGPSVTNMVKRLAEFGLARHEPYRGVALTEAGEKIALEVIRHHRLVELYLVEALGFGWDAVHAEAERLEHHISEELEARMAAALGHPAFDPHGDPIPGPDGAVAASGAIPLSELGAGAAAVVDRVADEDGARLRYLDGLGIRPGVRVELVEALPFDGPLRVRVGAAEQIIGRSLGSAIRVAADSGKDGHPQT